MASDDRVAPGDVLAGYRVVELVGRGGTGEVYRARDDRLDRDVALKLLSSGYAGNATFRARLVRESQLAASLDHPNVVPIYDAGDAGGQVYIAMRFVDGTDLGAELRRAPMTLDRVIEVAAQVADALDAAHQQALVHRDVKPSNVLVDARGHCYLTDFGVSRSIGDPARAVDAALTGTVGYVAPEQVRGGDVDGGADLYALTCMLFEMLTGELPFRRTTDVATLFAHLEEDPPSAVQLRPELPAAVDDVLARGLAKDPADRQDSCVALVDDARAALGLSAPPARRRSRLLIAGLVAALVAATIVVLLLRPWASEPTAAPAGSLVLIDPNSGAVTARTAVPGYPAAVASAPGGVWMADFRDGVLWRYEPETGALQHISSPGEPRDLAFVGDDVYVASDGPELFSGNISRHNSRSGLREQALTLLACSVGSGDGVLWAAGCPYVQRLNTDGGPLTELATVLVPYADPLRDTNLRMQIRELAIGDGSVWVLGDAVDRRLWRLDMVTGQTQATIDLPFPPRSIAVGNGQVWITDPLNDAVVPITAADNRLLAPVPVGRGAAGVAVGAGAVWVANAIDGTVSRIDPGTRQAVRTIDVGGIPHELSIDDRGVWVTTDAR